MQPFYEVVLLLLNKIGCGSAIKTNKHCFSFVLRSPFTTFARHKHAARNKDNHESKKCGNDAPHGGAYVRQLYFYGESA